VTVTPNADGSYAVVIREVRVNLQVVITAEVDLTGGGGNGDVGNVSVVTSNRVWSSDNNLYISSTATGQAQIYALTGSLVKTLSVSAGENIERITLPKGIYIVKLEGKSYKVRF
jgi:hypothetical protein